MADANPHVETSPVDQITGGCFPLIIFAIVCLGTGLVVLGSLFTV